MWFFIIALMLLSVACCMSILLSETYNIVINVMGKCCICILIAFIIYIVFFYDNKEKQSIADRYEQLVNLSPSLESRVDPQLSLESRVDSLRKCMERCTNQKDFHDVEHAIKIIEDFEKDYNTRKDYKTRIDVNSLLEKVTPNRHCKDSRYEYAIHRHGKSLALESIMRCCGICVVRREEISIH